MKAQIATACSYIHSKTKRAKTDNKTRLGGGQPYFKILKNFWEQKRVSRAIRNIIVNQVSFETICVSSSEFCKNYFDIFGLYTWGIDPDYKWLSNNCTIRLPPQNIWVPDMMGSWYFISGWLCCILTQVFKIFPWRYTYKKLRFSPKNLHFVHISEQKIEGICAEWPHTRKIY